MRAASNRRPSPPLEVVIDSIAPGGQGVAHATIAGKNRAIFVRGAAPGDRLIVAIDPSKSPVRGELREIITPGPGRVESPCPYVARCGACDWMHLSQGTQESEHVAIVRQSLPESWRNEPIVSHLAAPPLHYRTRARLHIRASGGRAIVGMNAVQSHSPVEVDTCVVMHPTLERARLAIAALLGGAHGIGEAQIALGKASDRAIPAVLELRWDRALPPAVFARVESAIAANDPVWAGARIWCGETTKPAQFGDPTPWITAADGLPLQTAAGGFAQASEEGNKVLAQRVLALAMSLAPKKSTRIVELFAGAGNFTIMLASHYESVNAVESDRAACEAAQRNLEARNLSATVTCTDASTYVWSPATPLIILDPPRTGARHVVTQMAKKPPRQAIYVSCDPPTLGRDLAILAAAGYMPRAIECVEMFPQTSHVETIVALDRRPAKSGGAP